MSKPSRSRASYHAARYRSGANSIIRDSPPPLDVTVTDDTSSSPVREYTDKIPEFSLFCDLRTKNLSSELPIISDSPINQGPTANCEPDFAPSTEKICP